ncbi:MAG: fucose isomerase [Oscillospiraceae bacterium]|nr:fucose isomerase [Oscillospiraceae bacterium]
MYKEVLSLGVAPTKRGFLSMEEAKRQKDRFMKVVRSFESDTLKIVDLDDIAENGIMYEMSKVPLAVEKFHLAKIDALFVPFCDFGEESVVASIAKEFNVPVLVWGSRDEFPNTDDVRGRDTQCGMFAATKVLRRHNVKYSYIYNVDTDSKEFAEGFDRFLRVAAVLKSLRRLRIAKVGERPTPFMSVMANDANLLTKFGITVVPISPYSIVKLAKQLVEENDEEYVAYYKDLTSRMDCSDTKEEVTKNIAGIRIAMARLMERAGCTAAAMECWPAFPELAGFSPCTAMGEMADLGYPCSCETDMNGAVTMAILRACARFEDAAFLADLTIRHPENDNAELLWHCGPFPYSLKDANSNARLVGGQERFELKDGNITVARFDEIDGEYVIFSGEGKKVEGPETNGTYVWLEVKDWKTWEEKLMFGPYIHHVGGIYGNYHAVLREVARYLGIRFDDADKQGIYSL